MTLPLSYGGLGPNRLPFGPGEHPFMDPRVPLLGSFSVDDQLPRLPYAIPFGTELTTSLDDLAAPVMSPDKTPARRTRPAQKTPDIEYQTKVGKTPDGNDIYKTDVDKGGTIPED